MVVSGVRDDLQQFDQLIGGGDAAGHGMSWDVMGWGWIMVGQPWVQEAALALDRPAAPAALQVSLSEEARGWPPDLATSSRLGCGNGTLGRALAGARTDAWLKTYQLALGCWSRDGKASCNVPEFELRHASRQLMNYFMVNGPNFLCPTIAPAPAFCRWPALQWGRNRGYTMMIVNSGEFMIRNGSSTVDINSAWLLW